MKRLRKPPIIATFLVAGSAILMGGCAQMNAKQQNADSRTAVGCPDAKAVRSVDLYGDWQARFEATPKRPASTARVTFVPHPETAGALSGRIVRDQGDGTPQTSVLAGGVGDGQFGIEESADEVKITGLWNGDVVPRRCGREISGTWIDPTDDSERGFTLQKQ